jgi:DNA-binding transcriptional regulator YbjK
MLGRGQGVPPKERKGEIAMTAFPTPSTTDRCGPGCPICADLRRAAVALVGAMGLEGVTPERLAQVAGLPAGALPTHACGDVDACVAAAYCEAIEGMQSRYAARLRAAATREEGLRDATGDLLAYLARHADVASFVSVEVLKGGRELLELRERLRRQSVENVRRELARFDGAAVAPTLQVEMLIGTMAHTIARHVATGETARLPDALDPALAMADACEPLPAG